MAVSGRTSTRRRSGKYSAVRDLLCGIILISGTLIVAGSGNRLTGAVDKLAGGGNARIEVILTAAILLNFILLLFGWRRYNDLDHEMNERGAAEERALTLALRDPLTGFLNRRSFAEDGSLLFDRGRQRGKAAALLTINLDHFKVINDLHGHLVGDDLLRACAAAIEKALPPSAIAARLGADEFACIFLFDPDYPDMIGGVADRIVTRLSQPFDLDGTHVHVSASVGVALSDDDCASVDALLRRADIAMSAAQKGGRNRACWFDASMERDLRMRNMIEAGLRTGIPRGEIVPYYEQQIDLETGALNGFEVLARWEHPTQGLIVPDMFIPVAEDVGLIAALSMSVMRQAFEEARGWDPSLTLSVNIAPGQLKDPWLAQKIVKLLVETGFPPNRLEIEITESSLLDNLGLAQSIVGSLKNQGIRLALDDFGTGYSSLAHLRALPFDRIKIDKSFVMSMNDNPESAAIVTAITKLGESLGLPVTAEGIENAAIAERLRLLGCRKGQGWHYGRPMAVGPVRRLLAEQALLNPARDDMAMQRRTG